MLALVWTLTRGASAGTGKQPDRCVKHRYGKSYIGDNSRYTFLGWFSTGDPSFDYSTGGATSEFVGIAIDQVDKVIHCNASKFEIPGRIECGSLSVNRREI